MYFKEQNMEQSNCQQSLSGLIPPDFHLSVALFLFSCHGNFPCWNLKLLSLRRITNSVWWIISFNTCMHGEKTSVQCSLLTVRFSKSVCMMYVCDLMPKCPNVHLGTCDGVAARFMFKMQTCCRQGEYILKKKKKSMQEVALPLWSAGTLHIMCQRHMHSSIVVYPLFANMADGRASVKQRIKYFKHRQCPLLDPAAPLMLFKGFVGWHMCCLFFWHTYKVGLSWPAGYSHADFLNEYVVLE